jgi:hypothetical protein
VVNPILFATQMPQGDVFGGRMAAFGNHRSETDRTPRGGDLMIRYPDGAVRNLTQEAGLGTSVTGANAIAVREPSVHWNGTKAVFSMLVGDGNWQIYEVTGLSKGQKASICKISGQTGYNNVSPLYATDDRILFSSDTPRNLQTHLYPMLDEYESAHAVTGLWSLNPATNQLTMLNNTPSGLFSPTIDSFGRVIFTRWDHLVQDQQSEDNGGAQGAYNTASEDAGAPRIARSEVFPERRFGNIVTKYGTVNQHQFNTFQPWQMNQDGTAELTLNHIGRHELSRGVGMTRSFNQDNALQDTPDTLGIMANTFSVRVDAGVFQMKEDPRNAGTYYATYAVEFASFGAGQLLRFNGAPGVNAELMAFTPVTAGNAGGTFRDPLPLSTGAAVAVHSPTGAVNTNAGFRLKLMSRDAAGNLTAGATLTNGIVKNGTTLWEVEPVEVYARARPTGRISDGLDAGARQVLADEGVSEAALQSWMRTNNLALIVTNNQTSRDRADKQQPYNLEVPGGVKTTGNAGKVYPIAHYQIIEGKQVRGYSAFNDSTKGRRVIGQPMNTAKAVSSNVPNPGGPAGSVKISPDGSTAAFVPANRALAWQTTDAEGEPIVRERVWVTMQAGEARTCAGCHGENVQNQAAQKPSVNKPAALVELLRYWKTLPK